MTNRTVSAKTALNCRMPGIKTSCALLAETEVLRVMEDCWLSGHIYGCLTLVCAIHSKSLVNDLIYCLNTANVVRNGS